ncbi:MAG: hypothetical protein PVJ84_05915 [Desulfobacteraceae bacterium]
MAPEPIIKADNNDNNDNDEFTLFLTLLFGKDHSDVICRAQHGTANTVLFGSLMEHMDARPNSGGGDPAVDSIFSRNEAKKLYQNVMEVDCFTAR